MTPESSPAPSFTRPASAADRPALRTVRSQDLLQGQLEVLIAHGAETYRLRLTRSGKLILQK